MRHWFHAVCWQRVLARPLWVTWATLCGLPAERLTASTDNPAWTNQRRQVTCPRCLVLLDTLLTKHG